MSGCPLPDGASLAFLDLSPDIAEEVIEACVDAYLAGLADVDAVASPVQVEFAALTTNAMRKALGAAGPVISTLLDPKLHPLVEQLFGVSLPAFVETRRSPSRSCGSRSIEPAYCWPN